MHSIYLFGARDSFGAQVCAVKVCLGPEYAQYRFVWSPRLVWSPSLRSKDSFGARVCTVEVRLEPESAQ